MKCLICRQAETVAGVTSVSFERGEMRLTVNHVPAHICPGCGEAYVDEEVAVRLLQSVDAIYADGMMDSVIEYSAT